MALETREAAAGYQVANYTRSMFADSFSLIPSWNARVPRSAAEGASRYDVRIGGLGGHGKADIVREVAYVVLYKSVPNADRGGQKSEIFVDIINGTPLKRTNR